MKNNFEVYKKLIIKWNEGGLSYKHYNEKMVITPNQIVFERKVDCHLEIEEEFDIIKWSIKIKDNDFLRYFNELCSTFFHSDEGYKMYGCDTNMFSIELVMDDKGKIKENYHGNLMDNGLNKLCKMIKNVIPKSFSKPYFLN